jgi:hypothetical protein
MKRDSQRQKVYDAERFVTTRRQFGSLDEVKQFISTVVGSRWWKTKYPFARREFKFIVGPDWWRASMGWMGTLVLPKSKWNDFVVLHELTHVAMYKHRLGRNSPAHGRVFCNHLLQIIRRFAGDQSWEELKEGFKAKRVKWVVFSHKPPGNPHIRDYLPEVGVGQPTEVCVK